MDDLIQKWKKIIKTDKQVITTSSTTNTNQIKSDVNSANQTISNEDKELPILFNQKSLESKDNKNITILINKIISLVSSNEQTNNKSIIVEGLKEINEYIQTISFNFNQKLKKTEEEKIILSKKAQMTEKALKDFENKFILCEKEKFKYKKISEEAEIKIEDYQNKLSSIENNKDNIEKYSIENAQLINVNNFLTQQIIELKEKHEFVIKNFFTEVELLEKKINQYDKELSRITNLLNNNYDEVTPQTKGEDIYEQTGGETNNYSDLNMFHYERVPQN